MHKNIVDHSSSWNNGDVWLPTKERKIIRKQIGIIFLNRSLRKIPCRLGPTRYPCYYFEK